ncbi:MAG TPA: leucyl aminopeptidase [Mycobacteriales bacterium]|nr:leucyl aminopeptidase [Mycobacteriales bacterium]
MTTLVTSATPDTKADALVIGVAKGPKGLVLAPGSEAAASAFGKKLLPTLVALGATGKAEEVTRTATLGALTAPVLVAVGLGDATRAYPHERLRRAAGAAVRAVAGSQSVALALPAADANSLRAVAEGALLGAYSFTRFRVSSLDGQRTPVSKVVVVTAAPGAKAVVKRAEAVSRAVCFARDLVNTPPSHLHPVELAAAAVAEAERVGVTAEVLDEKALKKGAYGGIVGVGQGSANPPRLVHLSYAPRGATTTVALVGKGITFDSGGISIKPAAGMEAMKSDMGGAAAVVASVVAAAELGLKVNVEAWVPMAENMPSGTAIRPSDVLTMRGGKKIEVNNTDAEGRLILADAMVRACEDAPDLLLDVATLTGAQLVALGSRTAGVMGEEDLRTQVVAAADAAGEAMWPMPLPEDLRKGLDSEVADMVNTGPREGGMLSAGLFLREFVGEGVRWAHLDIAGPAYHDGPAYGYVCPGGTGMAVRTLVELLDELST